MNTDQSAEDYRAQRFRELEFVRDDIRKHLEVTSQIGPQRLANLFAAWFSRMDLALQDLRAMKQP